MAFQKIKSSRTLRQKVYDQLRKKIVFSEILPGQTLSHRELAGEFGVSLMPVREALWQLESEKVICIESNRRVIVNKLSARELEEAFRLRITLESMAVESACALRPESAIPKVKALLESMEAAVKKKANTYMRKNTKFHTAIYTYADSPLLLEMISRLTARTGPYYRYAVEGEGARRYAMECHREMFEGFAEKSKKKIQNALQRDLKAAVKRMVFHLEKEDN